MADAQDVHILIADDRPENLMSIEAILDGMGLTLVRALSGREVLRATLSQEFAVILLDVRMPEMDGFEAAVLLRQREKTQLTPIIFLTAGDRSETLESRGYSAGGVDYLSKPIPPEVLRAKVGVFVDLFVKTREVQRLNEDLEARVKARTADFERANEDLLREISERRRVDAELRVLNAELEKRVLDRTAALESTAKELRSFSYSVSHDLRAPLRRITAYAQMLEEESGSDVSAKGAEYLSRIVHSCDRMQDLVEDLLQLSRVSSGEMDRERVDLSRLGRAIATELKESEPDRSATFTIEDDLQADGDPRLLRIALFNLLENAWKFTGKVPHAEIAFSRDLSSNGSVVFLVQDNGVGFDARHGKDVFAPFHRLHKESDFPGTGIGLAIVQRVVHRHGGDIAALPLPDGGAKFVFSLGTPLPQEAGAESGESTPTSS